MGLLRIAWFAAILPILIACLPFYPFNCIHHTLVVLAGRGKIVQSSSYLSVITCSFLSDLMLLILFSGFVYD